jgi:hypothetical protein
MELRRFWWWVVLVLVQFGINGRGCWDQERTALLQLKASMINYAYPDWERESPMWQTMEKATKFLLASGFNLYYRL